MVLLKLIHDLKRIHKWKIHIWHGDHGWHHQSGQIATELKEWCKKENLDFFVIVPIKQQPEMRLKQEIGDIVAFFQLQKSCLE